MSETYTTDSAETLAGALAKHERGEWRETAAATATTEARFGRFCTCGTMLDARDIDGSLRLHVAQALIASGAVRREDEVRAERLGAVAADLYRNHDMPPQKDSRSYSYRNGWWDGVHHAASVVRRAALAEEGERCDNRGPRIGDGCPRCRLSKGHDGQHRCAPADGWGDVRW